MVTADAGLLTVSQARFVTIRPVRVQLVIFKPVGPRRGHKSYRVEERERERERERGGGSGMARRANYIQTTSLYLSEKRPGK